MKNEVILKFMPKKILEQFKINLTRLIDEVEEQLKDLHETMDDIEKEMSER